MRLEKIVSIYGSLDEFIRKEIEPDVKHHFSKSGSISRVDYIFEGKEYSTYPRWFKAVRNKITKNGKYEKTI